MNNKGFLIALILVLGIGIMSGALIGNTWGYHEGVKDGKQASMITDFSIEPCTAHIYVNDELKMDKWW
ncbi:hypothetical protein [Gracilimonas sediminicola]|uniref:Uncharacterized protein n=1 Tax=Gracilimonas sediminicola TaxID=2952158 RepID=A0A9X2L0N3_9BACT|nr:hypothetical protein [Gracilimonas sediminicola]MCP9290043.1 hypothetical protein [Gracilimonas sediminicola]